MSDFNQTIVWKHAHDAETALQTLSHLGTAAFFTPSTDGITVVFPAVNDDTPDIGDYAAALLSRENAVALLTDIRQGDATLRLRLFEFGEPIDLYVAEPGYWSGEELPPHGGDAHRWCRAFGITDEDTEADLAALLSASRYDEDFGYVLASERHREIVELLGLPLASVGVGYREIDAGHAPEGYGSVAELGAIPSDVMSVQEYILLAAPADAPEEEIAAYLLPEVVSLELGLEKEEWRSSLGTSADIRSALSVAGNTHWIQAEGGVEIDLGSPLEESTSLETAILFAPPSSQAALKKIADAIGGTIWDCKARRVLYRAA